MLELHSLLTFCPGSILTGAAAIGHIYQIEERGSAMAGFLGVS